MCAASMAPQPGSLSGWNGGGCKLAPRESGAWRRYVTVFRPIRQERLKQAIQEVLRTSFDQSQPANPAALLSVESTGSVDVAGDGPASW